MDNIMDNLAYVVILALVVGMIPLCPAQSYLELWDYSTGYRDLNYEDLSLISATYSVDDGGTHNLSTLIYGKLQYYGILVKFIASDGVGDSDTAITRRCRGETDYTTFNLINSSSSWVDEGFGFLEFPISTINLTDDTYFGYCNVSASGEDLYMTAYIALKQSGDIDIYRVPSSDMESIVDNVDGVVDISFDLLDIMLTISIVVGLVFLLVLVWKLFEFFIMASKG